MKYVAIMLLCMTGTVLTAPASATCWIPTPAKGRISFDISQAGAPLQGTFKDYDGLICIDAANSPGDRIRVQIKMASVDTQLPELDEALRGTDFFDVTRWPEATFVSDSIRNLGNGQYQVTGKLTLRDVTREIKVPFSFQTGTDGNATVTGRLDIQRLDYHIGLGQWSDTRWVGNQVQVSFSVALQPAPQH